MKKVKDYFQLVKLSLSIMVVFSSVISYLLTQGSEEYVRNKSVMILLLFVGGMLVTGSANAINQVVEKEFKVFKNWPAENKKWDKMHFKQIIP